MLVLSFSSDGFRLQMVFIISTTKEAGCSLSPEEQPEMSPPRMLILRRRVGEMINIGFPATFPGWWDPHTTPILVPSAVSEIGPWAA